MTSCQTSRAVRMPNDASLVQTARKTAAAHTVPTQHKAQSVVHGAACCCCSKHLFKILQTWMTQWESALSFIRVGHWVCMFLFLLPIVVPQACTQRQLCLLYCHLPSCESGESGNEKHVFTTTLLREQQMKTIASGDFAEITIYDGWLSSYWHFLHGQFTTFTPAHHSMWKQSHVECLLWHFEHTS